MRYLRFTGLLIIISIIATGCYSLMGARAGLPIFHELEIGMTREEVEKKLADGGGFLEPTVLVRDANGDFVLLFPLKESNFVSMHSNIEAIGEVDRPKVVSIVDYSRMWGFMGYDVYSVFYDAEDRAVAFRIWHIN